MIHNRQNKSLTAPNIEREFFKALEVVLRLSKKVSNVKGKSEVSKVRQWTFLKI